MNLHESDRLYSLQEFAQRLRVSPRTVETLIAQGDAPPMILIGKQRRWKPEDVTAWLDSRRCAVAPAANNPLNHKESAI